MFPPIPGAKPVPKTRGLRSKYGLGLDTGDDVGAAAVGWGELHADAKTATSAMLVKLS